jgi:hypothetical protein
MTKLSAWIKGLRFHVINYQEEYGKEDKTINHAKGELSKPNETRWPHSSYIGTRFVGSGEDERGEYDTISIYLGGGWFKLISKVY